MVDYSIKNTSKQERIELIRSWQPEDEVMDSNDVDIWEMYRDYIDGKKEIAECNAAFCNNAEYKINE
ncbi:MAG: purine biosynthesis protein PurH [Lachnospiraceae bacterium]|nr:purine biosynthesis protein PurH [Lachnospiraceae bacterium]